MDHQYSWSCLFVSNKIETKPKHKALKWKNVVYGTFVWQRSCCYCITPSNCTVILQRIIVNILNMKQQRLRNIPGIVKKLDYWLTLALFRKCYFVTKQVAVLHFMNNCWHICKSYSAWHMLKNGLQTTFVLINEMCQSDQEYNKPNTVSMHINYWFPFCLIGF